MSDPEYLRSRAALDVGKVTAAILVKFVAVPVPADAEVADAWCRIVAAIGVKFDPRPNLDAAIEGARQETP